MLKIIDEESDKALFAEDIAYFQGKELDSITKEELLYLAICNKNKKMIRFFVNQGWSLGEKYFLSTALRKSDDVVFLKWLEKCGMDIYRSNGAILVDAAFKGHVKIFKEMYPHISKKVENFNKVMLFINLFYIYRLQKLTVVEDTRSTGILLTMVKDIPLKYIEQVLSKVENEHLKSKVMAEYFLHSTKNENKIVEVKSKPLKL